MYLKNNSPLIRFGLSLLFLITSDFSATCQRSAPIYNPINRTLIENQDSRAQALVNKNLNRFGLEMLKEYDSSLDSTFKSELKDTLELMEKTYLQNSSSLQIKLKDQNAKIKELSLQKTALSNTQGKLLRTAAISFVVWLLLVTLFLQFKKKKIKLKENELALTNTQLTYIKKYEAIARTALDKVRQLKNTIHKLSEDSQELLSLSKEIENDSTVSNKWSNEIISSVQKTATTSSLELRVAKAFMAQDGELSDEKENTNINKLCEEVLVIASRGILSSGTDINCQITNDFEKNLPELKVNQSAIASLLLNVFNNAFQSIEAKSIEGIKGYQPKISISTRILPRFLQIRIKDNGMGMTEAIMQNAFNPFYTTRENGGGAGLGLSESQKIMTTLHKGEIKIETENGNSTDVYIKFFL